MKFVAIASLGFAAAVAAQNSTTSAAATGCVSQFNKCRQPTNGVSANQAQCAAENAQCQGTCYAAYNSCRAPSNGVSANQAACAASYSSCLGENPFGPDGSLTLIPLTASTSATTSSAGPVSTAQCQAKYDSCRSGPDANHATCAAEFASCLGTNPFASNGTNTVTGNYGPVYTTEVVTALTTYCPAATTLTVNNKVYTVSSATTLTIKDCPCTISKPMTSATWTASTTGAKNNGTASATTSKPAVYTGAAGRVGAGFGLVGAAAGAIMLL